MSENISNSFVETELSDVGEYHYDIVAQFSTMPEVAKPLVKSAQEVLYRIENMLYTAPAFVNVVKASIPEEMFQVMLTDAQKSKLAEGALKLMTKKDGTLMANLVNPETNKIVSTISLKSVKLSPEITQAMSNYSTQMQMAQLAEQIQMVQLAIEEIRQGQVFDRLAMAYSCQQKMLQAMSIKNPELKAMALLRIANDAEDSRNLLMLSQKSDVEFIKNQPESFWGKMVSGANPEKIDSRMNEIREGLCAINMSSLVEAMAYQEMGEHGAARQSLQFYGDYIQKTYLADKNLVDRLDLIDPSPKNYWSNTLPIINERIQELSSKDLILKIGVNGDGTEEM